MAYSQQNNGGSNNSKPGYQPRGYSKPAAPASQQASKPQATQGGGGGGTYEKKPAIFSTGLFVADKPEAKYVAKVTVKEAVTIPAGSTIFLYAADEVGASKGISHKLQVLAASTK